MASSMRFRRGQCGFQQKERSRGITRVVLMCAAMAILSGGWALAAPAVFLGHSQGTDNQNAGTSFMFATEVPSGSELAIGIVHDSANVDVAEMELGWDVLGVFVPLADMDLIWQIEPTKEERIAMFSAGSSAFALSPNAVRITYAADVPCKQGSILYFSDVNQTTPVGAINAQWGVDPFEDRANNLPPNATPTFSSSQVPAGCQVVSAVSGSDSILLGGFGNLALNFTGASSNSMLYKTDVTYWLNRGTGSAAISSDFTGDFTANWDGYSILFHLSAMAVVIRPKDTTPPTGTILINNDDAYTTSANVTLTLSATDDLSSVTEMRFSNNGSTWTSPEPYATSKAYTLPTGDGVKTVYVRYKDGEGLWSGSFSDAILLDENGPTGSVAINGGATHTTSPNVTLTLSASDGGGTGVTQMLISNDAVFNEPWEPYATSKAWTLDAPGVDGQKTVYVLYRDATGHLGGAYVDTIVLDRSRPGCTVSTTSPSPTNVQPIPFTVTFTEAVTGFVSTDITVTNGDITAFNGGPAVYDIEVTPTGSPPTTVTVSVAENVAEDYAANLNTASNSVAVEYDNVQPTCNVMGPVSPTNVSPIVFAIQFNKPVSGLLAGEIVVTNGTKGALSGGGTSYTLPVTPIAQGDVTCQVPAGAAEDASHNLNQASNLELVVYDSILPGCTVGGPASPTNSAPIVFTITFDEDVTGLTEGEIVVTNGTKGALGGSGASYTLPVSPDAQGAVTCQVPAAAAQDGAGNESTASNLLSITYDSVLPACTVGGPASPTNVSPIVFTITFDEDVTGLTEGEIVVSNGTAGALDGSGASYTLPVTPDAQGVVACQVPADAAQDGAGNGNTLSNELSITYDSEVPGCTVTGPPSPTNTAPIVFTIAFDEEVSGLTEGEIVVTNGTKGVLGGGGASYTLPVTPDDQGPVTCRVPADAVQDGAGNGNAVSNTASVTYDSEAPTCIVSGPASPTNVSPITFTITFSEDVTGLLADTIVVTNGTKGVLGGGGASYTLPVTPDAQGEVTCHVPAGAAEDAAGNGNTVSNDLSIMYDSVEPTCVVTGPPSPVTEPPLILTITFGEAIAGFDETDIVLTNALAESLTTSDQITFALELAPVGMGEVTCQVPAGVAQDAADNGNEASNLYVVIYDSERPSCTISSAQAPATNTTPITFMLTFSEDVVGLEMAEIEVTGGASTTLDGSGAVYTLTVDPGAEGPVTCHLPENMAESADVGNPNTESNTLLVTYDASRPSCTIAGPASPTNTAPIEFMIDFSEDVLGLTADAIVVTNGTKGPLAGSGAAYSLPVLPLGQGDVTCEVPEAAAHDPASNDNTASNVLTIAFDDVRPTPTVTPPASPVHTPPIVFVIELDEEVTDLTTAGLTIGNGLPEVLTGAGAGPYTIEVVPLTMGDVTCQVIDGAVEDAAGNANVLSNEASVYYDNPSPSCLVTTSTGSHTNVSPIVFNIQFLVPVTGLEVGEIVVTNGVKGALTGSGWNYALPVTPSGQGAVTCRVPADAAQDGGGHGNTASNLCNVIYDTVAPTATITLDGPTPTTEAELLFSVDFSEDVGTSFDDAVMVTGTLAPLSSVAEVTAVGNDYTVYIAVTNTDADGTLGIGVRTTVQDLAGNPYGGGLSSSYTVRNWFGFSSYPANVYAYYGENAAFSVALNPHGLSTPAFQWLFDDAGPAAPVPLGGATDSTVTLSGIDAADEGDYWCVVTYFGEEFPSNQGTLAVGEHLEITGHPQGGAYGAGATHVFGVTTTGGFAPLTYLWKKDGVVLPGQTHQTLTLSPLTESDSGAYWVEVADAGTDVVVSNTAGLEVGPSALPVIGPPGLGLIMLGIAFVAGAASLARAGSRRHT